MSLSRLLFFYWFVAYVFWLPVYFLLKLGYLDLGGLGYFFIFGLSLFYVFVLFLAGFFVLRFRGEGLRWDRFGLRVDNLGDSFIFSGLAVFPSGILSLVALFLILSGGLDVEFFVKSSLALFIVNEFDKVLVPIVGFLHWFLSGVISFVFLMAFPYEIAERELGVRRAFFLTFVLWSGLYNGLFYTLVFGLPLQVSLFGELFDLVFLGLVFLLVYRRVRNCVGLIVGYVFVYEAPVKAGVYYGWGFGALMILLIFGVVWSLIGLVLFVLIKFRG